MVDSAIAGELVLWGATLWDPRVPAPLHTFDQLSSNAGGAGGVFHPNGGEIILNSEVCASYQAMRWQALQTVCQAGCCTSNVGWKGLRHLAYCPEV